MILFDNLDRVNPMKNRLKRQQGFYLLEALLLLTISISLMSLGARYMIQSADRQVNQVTAQQLQQVTQAAAFCLKDNYSRFKANPEQQLNWQELIDNGYLPSTFSVVNSYDQRYQFAIQSDNQYLKLVLTTQGGRPISEASLRQIAALAGPTSGYTSRLDPSQITGNQQAWVVQGVPSTIGHLASLSVIHEQEIMDAATFLRRTQCLGKPEYNTMETDLMFPQNKKILLGSSEDAWITSVDNSTIKLTYYSSPNDTWTTKITPTEIHLEGTGSGRKTYLGNDFIEHTGGKVDSIGKIRMDGNEISITNKNGNETAQIRPDGFYINNNPISAVNILQVPHVHIDDINSPDELQKAADKVGCHVNTGRLFTVRDNRDWWTRLCMCIWRPGGPGTYNFMLVANSTPSQLDWDR